MTHMLPRLRNARDAAAKAAADVLADRIADAELRDSAVNAIADTLIDLKAAKGLDWLRGMTDNRRQVATINGSGVLSRLTLFTGSVAIGHGLAAGAEAIVATLGRRERATEGQ